jgi:hypothetical protein
VTDTINTELAAWLKARQSALTVAKTTTTPRGYALDWVPIESQSKEKIATPPPSDLSQTTAPDPKKPTKPVSFDIGEAGPAGHVPILRPDLSKLQRPVTLEDYRSKRGGLLVNIHRSNKKPTDPNPAGYFHATSSQTTQVFGCDAWLNVWDPKIDIPSSPGDDHSISQTWLQNYTNPELQSLEAGLTVDNSLNGDSANHLFTFYTTNGYTAEGNNIGGYNRLDGGWVQYHPTIYPGIAINGDSIPGGAQAEIGIKYQLYQGNWWFGVKNNESGPWIWIGYYPTSLFGNGITSSVQWVSFGGEVYSALSNPCSTEDQMGSGREASAGWSYAAYQRNIRNQSDIGGTMVNYNGLPEVDVAANNCPLNSYTIHCFMNSGTSFSSYQYFGGPTEDVAQAKIGSTLTCLYSSVGSRVYYLDGGNNLRELAWNGFWSVSRALAAAKDDSALTCLFINNVGSRVYYLDQGNNVRELAWNGSGWNVSSPLEPAKAASALACLYTGNGSRVYYLDPGNGQINELAWNGSGWGTPTNTGAAPKETSALTCLFAGSYGSRVYYLDQANNVRELAWNGSGWNVSGPLASAKAGSALTCLYTGNASRVYYLDDADNIRELAWTGSSWNVSAPLASAKAGSALTCLLAGSNGSRVYYLDDADNIRELAWTGSGWSVSNALAPAMAGGPLTCLYINNTGSRVYYLSSDATVHELAWTGNGWAVT